MDGLDVSVAAVEMAGPIIEIETFLADNKPSIPLIARMSVATVLNATMMSMLGTIASMGCAFSHKKDAAKLLLDTAIGAVLERAMPASWDEPADFVYNLCAQDGGAALLLRTPFVGLHQPDGSWVDADRLLLMRAHTVFHLLASLGLQCCMVQDGPSSSQQSYMAPLIQLAAAETCKHIGQTLAEPELAKAVQGGVIDSILECVNGSGEASGVDRLRGVRNAWLQEAFAGQSALFKC